VIRIQIRPLKLKGTVTREIRPLFFHQTTPPGPLIKKIVIRDIFYVAGQICFHKFDFLKVAKNRPNL